MADAGSFGSRAVGAGRAPQAPARDNANSCGSWVEAQDARRERWAALTQVLWQISSLDRVRRCRRYRARGYEAVQVRARWPERRAHFAGLQTCGSVWACPLCSAKVLAGRADELVQVLDAWTERGGRVVMVALTMRHHQGQQLAELWGGLSEAWRGATGSRAARRALADVAGWVRRTESTVGANGWHLHVHALLFVPGDTTDGEAQALGETMFAGWRRRLVSLGFGAPVAEDGGLDVRLLDLSTAVGAVADYVAKGNYRETPRSPVGAALELAGPAKRGRRENRATMQLLGDLARHGLADDAELWHEWEQASRGRRAIEWSRNGFRAEMLAGAEERSDEELAAETDHGGELVCELAPAQWRAITRERRLPALLLELVEESRTIEAARQVIEVVLAERGIPPPLVDDAGEATFRWSA